MTDAATAAPLLECRGIFKRFAGLMALDGVDLTLEAGRVHGLVGSNGAGKSTLMKVLAGALPEHEGEILLDGRPVRLASPQAALAHGIAMVYQELSGVGQLSVAENLFLGRQPTARFGRVDWREMRLRARRYLLELDIDIDVRERLDRFPLVVRQMVEIARGLHSGARVLILDEPTSALSPPETQRLFGLVEHLKRRGVAVVFISHFLEDVLAICDDVTILRDGRRIETRRAAELDKHYVIRTMLGHGLEGAEVGYETATRLPARSSTPPMLEVSHLRLAGKYGEVNFSVAPGECLGLYGFVGAGHQEVVETLAGARRATGGSIALDGHVLRPGNVRDAVARGVVYVGGDRRATLVQGAPVYQNATLAHLRQAAGRWLTRGRETRVARPLLERVGCRPADPQLRAGSLSGGNQQKVVFAKWLLGPIRVLLLDEPTRGMDVGAKEDIMRLVRELKQAGAAVILSSNEPELILAHADRILVMSRGWIGHQFSGVEVDKAELMRCA